MAEQHSLEFKPEPERSNLKRAAQEALETAENLARRKDPSAGLVFEDAKRLSIQSEDTEMQMRVFESAAGFHARRGTIDLALEECGVAKRNAECLWVTSDAAVEDERRLGYNLLSIQNRELETFKNLEKEVRATDTYQARLKAWFGYVDDAERREGPLAARGLGSREDFRRRLDAAKLDASDDANDE